MAKKTQKESTPQTNGHIDLAIPFDRDAKTGRFPYHVNLTIGPDEASALQRAAEALDKQQAKLRSGQRVTNRRQAAAWIFEQIAEVSAGVQSDF